ncbi:MAG: gamma-glutamyl-gamma-aminobutyrate hydrolase family protein [Candidatus Acidiferrales bacterium]|jgi:putative glutamine amidotransferase
MSPDANLRPRVGIPYRTRKEELTGEFAKLEKYVNAVNAAAATPVPISLGLSLEHLERIARTLDAILLPGSPADVEPSLFRATRSAQTAESDADRERTDFVLLEHALAEQKPVLAICYGIQSLNVFLGGTLVQDIPSELQTQILHDWESEQDDPEPFHAAAIEPGSRLAQMAGAGEVVVNSSHHQSVLDPGRSLRVVSRALDGVIEAVEWTGDSNWVIGVQWHPERMQEKDSLARALFRDLAVAALARKTPASI